MNQENIKEIGKQVLSGILKVTKTVANLGVDIVKGHINLKNEEAKTIALQNQAIQQHNIQNQLGYEVGQLLSYGVKNYSSLNVNTQGIMNLTANTAFGNSYKFGLQKANITQNLTHFQERHLLCLMQKDLIKFWNMELQKYGIMISRYYPLLSSHQGRILAIKDTGVEFCLDVELI